MAQKTIEIIVKDGEQEYSCKLRRPDVATLSRANKLGKVDEVLGGQELLKGCWVEGDREIQEDGYLMLAAVSKLGVLQDDISAEIKN